MPLLALPPSQNAWSVGVQDAHQRLHQIFDTAESYLESGSLEPHRLRNYANSIFENAYPLVLLLSETASRESLPIEWVEKIATDFTDLLALIEEQWLTANNDMQGKSVEIIRPVTVTRTGKRGRPKKSIDPNILHEAFKGNRKIPKTVLANVLGINRRTLNTKLDELNIDTGSSQITDEQLDGLITEYRQKNPRGGRAYVIGRLRANNLRVPRSRVIDSMNRVDRLGQGLKQQVGKKKEHQPYHVPRPNTLWHIDGHHKLIQWGIVIHGVADGYSRKITGLRASTNNRAETVLEMFIDAIREHGVPWRVRGDRGGENRDVSILMILLRGLRRASFMWGPSVFNTRIERLWVEVGKRFVRQWRAFFMRLERCHLLKRNNPNHRWLLHRLFLDEINNDCQSFCEEWNNHPISGFGEGKSPNDLVFLGELKDGVYTIDECEGLSEEEIYAFYNFANTGELLDNYESNTEMDLDITDSDSDNSDSDSDSIHSMSIDISDEDEVNTSSTASNSSGSREDDIDFAKSLDIDSGVDPTEIVDRNIRHAPVPVPASSCPFNTEQQLLFDQGLQLLRDSGDLPGGYGVLEDEMGDNGFDEQEEIQIGLQKRGYRMELPSTVWRPRTETWAQGLYVMTAILAADS